MNNRPIVFLQISHRLSTPTNPVLDYYEQAYKHLPGYAIASPHYLEIPEWIARLAGTFKEPTYPSHTLYIVTSIKNTIEYLSTLSADTLVFGSVLDAQRETWLDLVTNAWYDAKSITFHLGGYVEPGTFEGCLNVRWYDSIAEIATAFPNTDLHSTPDYSLFEGQRCIPRLALSTGCLFTCAFCTVPRTVTPITPRDILDTALSFQPLDFDLVYLDDKTFGQCSNWKDLALVYLLIKQYNPTFKGFIVQTTVGYALKHAHDWYAHYHVQYIEIGVETLDADVLKLWRKPYAIPQLDLLTKLFYREPDNTPGLIVNLIFGIEDHDYANTLAWLRSVINHAVIQAINPFILCEYHDSKGSVSSVTANSDTDRDECTFNKSWLSHDDQLAASLALDQACEIALGENQCH